MTPSMQSTGLARLVRTALVFSAGVLASNRVNHFIGTRGATEPVPLVTVAYAPEGVYIDKQRYVNGRLGGPRCDWNEIAIGERRDYALDALATDNSTMSEYLGSMTPEQKQQLVYRTLVHLARERGTTPGKQAEDIERSLGWRWNLVYTAKTPE